MLCGMAFAPQTALAQAAGETTLPSVEVKDTRDREEKGYQGGTTNVGKLPQLPRDIPQSVTIVTEQLMHDRNADTFREALRNVAGLTFNAGEGGRIGDNVTLRGYSAVGDLYLDGMRDIAQYNRETFNLEQIDVLRGSASMLFGRGSTGGVINQVSKQPFLVDRNEVAVTYGSYDYKRATADLNKVVGENAAVRVNLMSTDTDSFRDAVHQERYGIAPSFRWGIGTQDEFSLAYYKLKDDNIPDYGVPYFQGKPLAVPVNRFYGIANNDFERNDTGIATASYIHRFDQDTSLRTVLRKADYERDLRAVAPRLAGNPNIITDSTVINRQRQARGGDEHTLTSQTDFTTKLSTGSIKHQLLTGLELVEEKTHRWNSTSSLTNPTTTVGNPSPYPPLPAGFSDSFTRTGDVRYKAHTVGIYGQDILELTPQWKLLLGARYDDFSADYDRPPPQGDLSRTDRVWSYRTGLIFQPSDTQSYYVSYGTSFNPSGEAVRTRRPRHQYAAGEEPQHRNRREMGADGWHPVAAHRDLPLRKNQRAQHRPAVSIEQNLLSGKRHTDGIEFETAGRITPDWEVFGAVAFMKAEIDAATGQQADTIGKTPLNTPDYTYSVWTTYKLGGGWRIGGGADGAGLRYGQNANTTAAPSYIRWDALVEYQQARYAIKLNILNLFDKDYYEGVYQGHVVPGMKRAAQLTVSTRF